MALSKKRLALATVIASITLGGGQAAQAQVRIVQPTSAAHRAPVLVHFRTQVGAAAGGASVGGAGASGPSAGGPSAAGASGASGVPGAGTTGATGPLSSSAASALPGGASGQPSAAPTGSPGGGVRSGSVRIGGAGQLGISGTGQIGPGSATAGAQVGELPSASSGRLTPLMMQGVDDPIQAANISVDQIGTRVVPEDQAVKHSLGVLPLPDGQDRGIDYVTYRWQAANICHWPLYFEEPMLERHGQQRCPTYLQPAVSGAKFFTNVALYPYKATLWPACESRYTLGHFRPGSPVPTLRDTLPWSRRAAVVQGAAVTGVAVGLPW